MNTIVIRRALLSVCAGLFAAGMLAACGDASGEESEPSETIDVPVDETYYTLPIIEEDLCDPAKSNCCMKRKNPECLTGWEFCIACPLPGPTCKCEVTAWDPT